MQVICAVTEKTVFANTNTDKSIKMLSFRKKVITWLDMNITKIQNKLIHLCNTVKPVWVSLKRVKENQWENQYTDYARLQRTLSLYKPTKQ